MDIREMNTSEFVMKFYRSNHKDPIETSEAIS
jgi:hypothetical protein